MRRNKWYYVTNLCSYVLQLNFIQVRNMPCILSRVSTVYYTIAAGVKSFKWLPVWSDSGVASRYFQVIIESFVIIWNALLCSFQNIFKCFTAFIYPLETRRNCICAINIFVCIYCSSLVNIFWYLCNKLHPWPCVSFQCHVICRGHECELQVQTNKSRVLFRGQSPLISFIVLIFTRIR